MSAASRQVAQDLARLEALSDADLDELCISRMLKAEVDGEGTTDSAVIWSSPAFARAMYERRRRAELREKRAG